MTPDSIARLAGKLLYTGTRLTMIGSTVTGVVSGEKQELETDMSLYKREVRTREGPTTS